MSLTAILRRSHSPQNSSDAVPRPLNPDDSAAREMSPSHALHADLHAGRHGQQFASTCIAVVSLEELISIVPVVVNKIHSS